MIEEILAFPSEPYDDKTIAYKQGAAFIAKCLKKIVNDENHIKNTLILKMKPKR